MDALAQAARALRLSDAARRPAVLLLELAALAAGYAGLAAPQCRAQAAGAAALLLGQAYLIALTQALAEAGPRGRAGAWRAAGRGQRTKQAFRDGAVEPADADHLRAGDWIVVEAGGIIPADGLVIEGAATVDESALTGESAPVLREAAAPRARVIGGTRVLSDKLKIKVDGAPGEGLLRRLADRLDSSLGRAAPRESVLAIAAMLPALAVLAAHRDDLAGARSLAAPGSALVLLALCAAGLLPTALSAFLGAAGSLGVRRLLRRGLLARDERAVAVAARAKALILEEDAATFGRRRAVELVPAPGIPESVLVDAAQLTALIDETPEGRSIMALAKAKGLRGRRLADLVDSRFVPLSPHTRVSGLDANGVVYRKGATAALTGFVGGYSPELAAAIDRIGRTGGEALAVALDGKALGLAHMREPEDAALPARLARLRAAGLRVVLAARAAAPAAAALGAALGVDETAPAATPAGAAELAAREQAAGRRVAAAGDAVADAALLAKADAAVARGLRESPAADAAILDLEGQPAKIVDALTLARRARRARGAFDAFFWLCDAGKGVLAASLLVALARAALPGADASSAPGTAAGAALAAAALAPLLLLAAAALAGAA
jgi:K+-transporting ATPase ATPase B chain